MTRSRSIAAAIAALAVASSTLGQSPGPNWSLEVINPAVNQGRDVSVASDGVIYLGHEDNGTDTYLYRIDPADGVAVLIGDTALNDPDSVLWDAHGGLSGVAGSVFSAGACDSGGGCVWAVDPDGTTTTVVANSQVFGNCGDIAQDASGRLYLVGDGGWVYRVALDGTVTQFVSLGTAAGSVDIAPNGDVFTRGADGVIRIHDQTGTLLDGNFATLPTSGRVSIGPNAEVYATTGEGDNRLVRVGSDGSVTTALTGLFSYGIDIAPDGSIVMTHSDDPQSGIFEVIRVKDCPGNVDGDLTVGINDVLMLLGEWGAGPGSSADLNADGTVDVADMLALLAGWGDC